MRKLLLFVPFVIVCACGDSTRPIDAAVEEQPPTDCMISDDALIDSTSASIDASIDAFIVSSTAITDGRILRTHSCFGANISPPLAWSNAPTNTLSYAVVFSDVTNGLVHSAIWDITPAFSNLPENVEKVAEPSAPSGSKQPLAYDLTTRGYLGPCSGEGQNDTYRFTVYAVDEYPLSGVTLQTSRQMIRTKAQEHALGEAHLEALF